MPSKLDGVHPALSFKISNVLSAMKSLGFEMVITSGVRTLTEQQKLYAQGRTTPGNIVTNADGVKNKSNHQLKSDGYGHAVDCVFLKDGKPSWDLQHPWKLYGACVESQGLIWGGNWKKLTDLPHAELP